MSAPSSDAPAKDALGAFITVGTSLDPFDRLLRLVDDLCAAGRLPGPVLAQSGACRYVPRGFATVPFLPAAELEARIRAARVVICHGGAGSIGTCLQAHKRPIVVPRRVAHGEIVNDHQLQLCRQMQAEGRILLAEDAASLAAAVDEALRGDAAQAGAAGGALLKGTIAALLSRIAATRAGRRR